MIEDDLGISKYLPIFVNLSFLHIPPVSKEWPIVFFISFLKVQADLELKWKYTFSRIPHVKEKQSIKLPH